MATTIPLELSCLLETPAIAPVASLSDRYPGPTWARSATESIRQPVRVVDTGGAA